VKKHYVIRKAAIKDLSDVLRLNYDLFKKERREFDKSLDMRWTYGKKGREYFRNRIAKKDSLVEVAEYDGKIVGYLSGGLSKRLNYRKKAKCAELENMMVEKKHRSRGLGAKLVRDFVDWCGKNKIDCISLTAFAGNKRAIKFYRNMGFKDYTLALEMGLKKR